MSAIIGIAKLRPKAALCNLWPAVGRSGRSGGPPPGGWGAPARLPKDVTAAVAVESAPVILLNAPETPPAAC